MAAKYSAQEIASLIVRVANDLPGNHIDNLKLNKLCYYAQGWHLAKFGAPLFDEEIQAWSYGPVVPSVYHAYKICGNGQIEAPAIDFDESVMTPEERELIADVYINYGKYTSAGLLNMTHMRGTPWDKVFAPSENNIISKESIEEFFKNSEEMKPIEFNFSEEHVATGIEEELSASI